VSFLYAIVFFRSDIHPCPYFKKLLICARS
jgi:hypothetical protein